VLRFCICGEVRLELAGPDSEQGAVASGADGRRARRAGKKTEFADDCVRADLADEVAVHFDLEAACDDDVGGVGVLAGFEQGRSGRDVTLRCALDQSRARLLWQ
jgi:hypothetical protein